MRRGRRLIRRRLIVRRQLVRAARTRAVWARVGLIWRKPGSLVSGHFARPVSRSVFNRWSPRVALNLQFALNASRYVDGRTTSINSPVLLAWRQRIERALSAHSTARTETEVRRHSLLDRKILNAVTQIRTLRERKSAEAGRIHGHRNLLLLRGRVPAELTIASQLPVRGNRPAKRETNNVVRAAETRQTVWLRSTRHFTSQRTSQPNKGVKSEALPIRFQVHDLIWRTESEPWLAEAFERSVNAAVATVAASGSVQPSPTSTQQSTASAEIHSRQMLDPALVDRLAEDVMGRMERRIRIERERRGI